MLWKLLAFGLMFGLGGTEVRRFENAAAREIGSKLEGPDKRVEVRTKINGPADLERAIIRASNFSTNGLPLFTEPESSKRGRLRNLRLELRDFVLSGLRVASLEADIPECRFDWQRAVSKKLIRLSQSGVGTGRVRLLEDDLEAWILRKFREIKRIDVRLDRNRVWVKGFGEFVVIQTEFEVIAKLIPVDGTKLMLAEAKVFFDGLIADEAVRDLVLNTLNPVVDLDKDLGLHGAVQVEEISMQNGVLEAWGKTKIPNKP
jgi:hypothetical protein